MVDAEIRRLSRHLEALLRLRKIPIRALERQLGFGGGTMNRIFSGKIELKVRHILLILETLDIEPARFFHHVYAEPDKPLTDEQVLATAGRMNRRRPGEEADGDAEPPTVSMSELQAAVLQVLEKIGFDPPGGKRKKPKKERDQEEEKERGAGKEEPPAQAKGRKNKPVLKPKPRKPPSAGDGPS